MQSSVERVIAMTAIVASILFCGRAQATTCQNNSSHQCWTPLSGPNYSQVVVGYPFRGVGIACAVQSPQGSNWGSRVDCYAPDGTSGAVLLGRTGDYVAGSPFVGTDPSKRIVSMASSYLSASLPQFVTIWALRSDGNVFTATTVWPRAAGGDPTFPFQADSFAPPSGLRSIAWTKFTGLYGVTTNNQLFLRTSSGWVAQGGGSVALLAGAPIGGGISLLGSDATSTTLGGLAGAPPPMPLPQALTRFANSTDPNVAFSGLGQATPLAYLGGIATALVPGTCPSGSATPCIIRSTSPQSGWQSLVTGDIEDPSFHPVMPWTIQDGRAMRGADGEVWVIYGAQRLSFWAP
jgi:hypothetical protein